MFRRVWSMALVGCLVWHTGYATEQPASKLEGEPSPPVGKVIILSDEIGPEIDWKERDRYKLFPISDLLSARIIQEADSRY
jgi:hypothetical protein